MERGSESILIISFLADNFLDSPHLYLFPNCPCMFEVSFGNSEYRRMILL